MENNPAALRQVEQAFILKIQAVGLEAGGNNLWVTAVLEQLLSADSPEQPI